MDAEERAEHRSELEKMLHMGIISYAEYAENVKELDAS